MACGVGESSFTTPPSSESVKKTIENSVEESISIEKSIAMMLIGDDWHTEVSKYTIDTFLYEETTVQEADISNSTKSPDSGGVVVRVYSHSS